MPISASSHREARGNEVENDIWTGAEQLGKLLFGGAAAGALYKLIEKWLDLRDKRTEREMPIVKAAAGYEFALKRVQELTEELKNAREEIARKDRAINAKDEIIREKDIDLRQQATVIQGAMSFMELAQEPQVQNELRKAYKRKQGKAESEMELEDLG